MTLSELRPLFAATLLVAAGGFAGPATTSRSEPRTPPRASDAQPTVSTSLSDQVDLAVTVYNSNTALVRDTRQVALPDGATRLQFVDIAAAVNPATVHVRSLTDPSRLETLEQNYEYDLLDPDKLLRKYVGRDVVLVRRMQQDGNTTEQPVKATLLAYNNGPVWKIGNEIVTGMAADHFRFPELPGNLYSRPTLVWLLQNTGPRSQHLEVSYLTGNIAWNADYVLTVGRDDKTSQLGGWVTVKNDSGTAYHNAKLQLVAGDLNRIADRLRDQMPKAAAMRAMAESVVVQESFSEYHLYTMPRPTTIEQNETKQISLLDAPALSVQKIYVVEGQQFYYRSVQHPGSPIKDHVGVYYKFKNDQPSGLGLPLPAGNVRVYQADSKGGIQFVGEDRIEHTPKDEAVTLKIGNAFDIVCERKQTDFKRIASNVYEAAFELTLRNHKDVPVTIDVNEPVGGDWQVLESSHQWTKSDAFALHFSVPVAKDGTSVLRYRVRVTW